MGCGQSTKHVNKESAEDIKKVDEASKRANEAPAVVSDMTKDPVNTSQPKSEGFTGYDNIGTKDGTISSNMDDKPPRSEYVDDNKDEGPDDEEASWILNNKNRILILHYLELKNLPDTDLVGKTDPFLVVTSTSHKKFKYTSTVRHDNLNASWILDLPFLVRPDVNDRITIRIQDEEIIGSENVGRVTFFTHDLLERMDGHKSLIVTGFVKLKGDRKTCTFKANFKYQEWSKAYTVMGDEKSNDKVESSIDAFARVLITGAKQAALNPEVIPVAKLTPPTIRSGPQKTFKILDGKIELMTEDPEFPVSNGEIMMMKIINLLPMDDDSLTFKSRGHAEAYIAKQMDEHFVKIASEGPWDDVTSDESFTRFMFQNNGSQWVRKTEDGFVSEMSALRGYDVRKGYINYGCDVVYDKEGKPIKIIAGDEVTVPTDAGWDAAKMFARTAAFPFMSAIHLMYAHYIWANYPNVAMLTHLDIDHPIRRLLHVHYFRSTQTILKAVVTLVPNKGLVHRSTALTHPALKKIFKDTLDGFKFSTFPDDIKARNMQDEKKLYPLAWDGIEFHSIIKDYVSNYVDAYYKSEEDVQNDKHFVAFWNMMSSHMAGIPELNLENMKIVLGECIFRVTGFHEHCGNVNTSGVSPAMISPHIRKGALLNSPESALIVGIISALTTGMIADVDMKQFPCLAQDWSSVMLDDKGKEVFNKFHEDMLKLSETIEERNKTRWVFNDFNPKWVQTSVSA